MKKFITSKNVIQLVLSGIAFISFGACWEIGNKYKYDEGELTQYIRRQNMTQLYSRKNIDQESKSTDITSQSGFNGGALGMGIICASCIMGIVFIETSKK